MSRLLQPLFALLAGTHDTELARMVEYLKAENAILRAELPTRLTVTIREKRHLVALGTALGSALNSLITVVSYRTFTRWAAETESSPTKPKAPRQPGRPRTAEEVCELIVRLATENGWGCARVLGELKKPGIHTASRTTVKNILREAGLDPGPNRGQGTWDEFIRRHAATLRACEFLSVQSVTVTRVRRSVRAVLHPPRHPARDRHRGNRHPRRRVARTASPQRCDGHGRSRSADAILAPRSRHQVRRRLRCRLPSRRVRTQAGRAAGTQHERDRRTLGAER